MNANRPLCLTICGYRAAGLSEDEYREHYVNTHVPLVRGLLIKHGIKQYSMTHNTDATRKQIGQLYDPQFIDMPDYDSFIQIVFDDIQDFANFQADPEFIKNVAPDHTNFHDPKRTRLSIGYIEHFIMDNQAVGQDQESQV